MAAADYGDDGGGVGAYGRLHLCDTRLGAVVGGARVWRLAMSALILSVVLWPLWMALMLLWRPWRNAMPTLLPLALLPAGLAWLGSVLGWFELAASWPDWLLGISFRLDSLSLIWLGLTLVVWLSAAVHSHWVTGEGRGRYALFFLLSLSGSLMLVLAADALTFYLGFSVMSLSAWGLVVHEQTPQAWRAGRWYIALALLGELLLFIGIVWRSAELATTDLALWAHMPSATAGLFLIWFGLAIKVGVPFLHVWLPLAHPAAPVPASAVLSGVMIKAGVLGWLLLLPMMDGLMQPWSNGMAWLGVLTMLAAAGLGLMQTEPKTILAYSSISQMGWMLVGVSLVWRGAEPALMALWVAWFALHHGILKAGLFLGVGWVRYGLQGIRMRWFVWSGLMVFALLMAGLPFTSGAWLKDQLKYQVTMMSDPLPLSLMVAGGVGTSLLMIHFLRRLAAVVPETKSVSYWANALALFNWLILLGLALAWPVWVFDWQFEGASVAMHPLLLALVLAVAWRIRIHRQYTCPPGDVLLLYARMGAILMAIIRRYQAWYAHQTQHIKWAYLRLKFAHRRVLKWMFHFEVLGLNWLFFVFACILLVILALVAVWVGV